MTIHAPITTTPFGPAGPSTKTFAASADGVKLRVEEWGNPLGRPILFVHAWSQSRLGWLPQITSELLAGHRLIAFDHRGHGESDKPDDFAAYANDTVWGDDIAAVIETKNLKDAVIVGWSMGGLAVLDYLRRHGQAKIAGVVLVGHVNAAGVPAAAEQFGDAPALHAADAMAEDLDRRIAGTLGLVRALVNKEMPIEEFGFIFGTNMIVPSVAKGGMLTREVDHGPTLEGLAKPVLIVHGTDDRIATVKAAERAHALAPRATLKLYEGAAHAPAWEERERFNAELAAFAAGL